MDEVALETPDGVESVFVVFTGASMVFVAVTVVEDVASGVDIWSPSFTF